MSLTNVGAAFFSLPTNLQLHIFLGIVLLGYLSTLFLNVNEIQDRYLHLFFFSCWNYCKSGHEGKHFKEVRFKRDFCFFDSEVVLGVLRVLLSLYMDRVIVSR